MEEHHETLNSCDRSDPTTAEDLLPLVYDELRALAAEKLRDEKPGQTLQATALVHEAYVRLVDVDYSQDWKSRRHFFCAAAEAMRRILVDRSRRRGGFGLVVHPTGDIAADMDKIRAFYADKVGRYPDQFGEVRLKEEM